MFMVAQFKKTNKKQKQKPEGSSGIIQSCQIPLILQQFYVKIYRQLQKQTTDGSDTHTGIRL